MHLGFSERDCVGELIDNALDSGARNIHLHLADGWLYVVDDGRGMNADGVRQASILNRNTPTGSKHGRFGVGATAAKVCLSRATKSSKLLTQAQGSALVVSNVDWDCCVKEDKYTYSLSQPTDGDMALWTSYRLTRGTIVGIECAAPTWAVLQALACSADPEQNLAFWCGLIYHKHLAEGLSMSITLNNDTPQIVSGYDPLEWSDSAGERQGFEHLDVYKQGHSVRVYIDHGPRSSKCWLEFASGPTKEPKKRTAQADGWEHVGKMALRLAYKEEDSQTKSGQERFAETPRWTKQSPGRPSIQGIQLMRGDKIVDHVPPPWAIKQAPDARRTRVVSRYSLKWSPSPQFDTLMGVQVNKCHIQPAAINHAIMDTVNWLCKQFATERFNVYKNALKAAETKSSDEEAEPPAVDETACLLVQEEGGDIQVRANTTVILLNKAIHTLQDLQTRLDKCGPKMFLKYARQEHEMDIECGF